MITYEEKKRKLYENMKHYLQEDICLAFSGGVDSSLLLILAKSCVKEQQKKSNIYAVTFDTMLHPSCDLNTAKKVAKEAEVFHQVLFVNELEQEEIRFNPEKRCYLCKKTLFSKLQEFAKSKGISIILEGTNEDDLHVYRPGLQAIQELGIKSPLAEAGFTKEEVHTIGGLLLTLIILFSFQGETILNNPLHIVLIAVPLVLQTVLIFFVAYGWAKWWKLPHNIAAPAGMIGASNFFELSVAVAISLFGLQSGAALVTVVGVLVEVPVMLMLVRVANNTCSWFTMKSSMSK